MKGLQNSKTDYPLRFLFGDVDEQKSSTIFVQKFQVL